MLDLDLRERTDYITSNKSSNARYFAITHHNAMPIKVSSESNMAKY